jgi:uncharacterized protein (TIGR02996 family)
MSDAEAFERAILANPEERATYSAYADWLQEHDDPRGEFIAVQLALEDESQSKDEREVLKAREAELLKAHEREWLGELAPFVYDENTKREIKYGGHVEEYSTGIEVLWERGILSGVTVERLNTALAHTLIDSPAARLVRELHVYGTMNGYYGGGAEQPHRVKTPKGVHEHSELFELIGSAFLANLRFFRLGDEEADPSEHSWCDCHTYADGLEHVVAAMVRIKELHLLCKGYDNSALFRLPNLTNLRVLRAYHQGEQRGENPRYEYPLDVLAANAAFANLTHLQFHPHFAEEGYEGTEQSYIPLGQVRALLASPHLKKLTHLQLRLSDMGDDGIREIIDSGILKQLKWLDLRHGCITDDGAKLLAACPDAKRLERIDLSYNGVTATGLAAMRNAKINAVANNPLTQTELNDREYLRQGDFE